MTKWLLGIAAIGYGSAALAQVPYPPYPAQPTPPQPSAYPYPPSAAVGGWSGFGVAQTGPPVSPYLGLFLGQNPGVNYYLGTQTARQAYAPPIGYGYSPFPVGATSPLRSGFLPAAANPTDEPFRRFPEIAPETRITKLPPSAHPVTFGGAGRYYPGANAAAVNRPGFTAPQPPPAYSRPGGPGATIPRIR